jgi:hypothetical protein
MEFFLRDWSGWSDTIVAHIVIPQSIAWGIFTKGIDRDSAYPKLTLVGDTALAEHVLKLVAIVG